MNLQQIKRVFKDTKYKNREEYDLYMSLLKSIVDDEYHENHIKKAELELILRKYSKEQVKYLYEMILHWDKGGE